MTPKLTVVTQSGAGPTDAALVTAAAAGERWAQEALYRRYARLVNGLSFRLMANRHDAEELAQDAFIQALQSLPRLQNQQSFSSWLSSIVVRTAHKRVRREKLMTRLGLRRHEPVDLDLVVSRSAPPDVQVELRAIYAIVEELGFEDRAALILRRVEGMSIAEIAEQLGRSVATVKRRLQSAEAHLARRLERSGASLLEQPADPEQTDLERADLERQQAAPDAPSQRKGGSRDGA